MLSQKLPPTDPIIIGAIVILKQCNHYVTIQVSVKMQFDNNRVNHSGQNKGMHEPSQKIVSFPGCFSYYLNWLSQAKKSNMYVKTELEK